MSIVDSISSAGDCINDACFGVSADKSDYW